MNKLYDKNGREIKVGDYIVYGHAIDRSAGLRFGRVLKIKIGTGREVWGRPEGTAITVIGVVDDRYSLDKDRNLVRQPPELLSRVGTLMYPERIIVLDGKDMLLPVRRLLDTYSHK